MANLIAPFKNWFLNLVHTVGRLYRCLPLANKSSWGFQFLMEQARHSATSLNTPSSFRQNVFRGNSLANKKLHQVKIWFQNRRAKERKQMKKRDELLNKDKMEIAGLPVHPGQMAAMSGWKGFFYLLNLAQPAFDLMAYLTLTQSFCFYTEYLQAKVYASIYSIYIKYMHVYACIYRQVYAS